MRVHLLPAPADAIAVQRVVRALQDFAPKSVEFVGEREADLVVIGVVGRHDRVEAQARGKRYALIQYVVRSSLRPSTRDWVDLWRGARVVWSYYHLPQLCAADGVKADFSFYYAPLGVSADFQDQGGARPVVVLTSGRSYLNESVRECILAARAVGRPVVHLGPRLGRAKDVPNLEGLTDTALAGLYSRCEWVAGLRREEGFELPAAEGVVCGARPVMFDQPHYRAWYDGLAEFIPEGTRADVLASLETLFRRGARPVTDREKMWARSLFDWSAIVKGFWERTGA